MKSAIVVDMGGTSTRLGVYHDDHTLTDVVRFATPRGSGSGSPSARERHLDRVAAEADRLHRELGTGERRELGVGVGATVDASGRIRNAAMLWGEPSTGFDLLGALRDRLPWADVAIANDIAAAAWRYAGLGRFGLVTVSTGIAIKIFDDTLPFASKLLLDPDELGGEIGHVLLYSPDGPSVANGGDYGGDDGAPRCECGNAGDLCSYASGPATARAAARAARRLPAQWRASALPALCGGTPEQITTHALARAARLGDGFATQVIRDSTRPLAALILQLSAQLGLRKFVIMGGFAHGAGEPWFRALRANLGDLLPGGGWFTGWTQEDLASLAIPSAGDDNDSLAGMGAYLAQRREQVRELRKVVRDSRTVIRYRPRPLCGREQFIARILFAGICGTDLQILRGERGCEPGVPGHECVAEILETGRDTRGVEPGQVISVNPNNPYDEHDKLGHNKPGVLRDVAVWDQQMADRGQVITLPPQASRTAEWTLLEPLACTVRSLRAGGEDWKGRRTLVAGAGVSGLLHVLLARHWYARDVLLANRGRQRLGNAVARGIVPAGDCLPLDEGLRASLDAVTAGGGLDSAIVAVSGTGGPGIVESLWPYLADAATVHLSGGFAPDAVIRTPDGAAVRVQPIRSGRPVAVSLPGGRRCTLVGSRGAQACDFAVARDILATAAGEAGFSRLVSHVISLDATPAVLTELATSGRVHGDPALRVVVDPRMSGDVVRTGGFR
jgi:threonine dehydrogenase-like Zn-dependent dehydrogenase/predicted NBD/HSP70 family sugar kinase